jgi:hypothetical protein
MRRYGRRNGNLDISQGTPVETRQHVTDSFASSVTWPVAQAFVIAVSTVALVVAVTLSPLLMGDRAFWFGSGIAALASFLYGLKYESRWMDRLSWPLIVGIIFWCLYAFSDGVFEVPHSPWLALFSLVSVIFSATLCLWLWVSVGQRLVQQSLHQERYLWETIANAIEWLVKKPKPRPAPPTVWSGRDVLPGGNGHEPESYASPIEELTEVEMFLMLADEFGTLARDDSKGAKGLRGKTMANGQKLSKSAWRRSLDWLLAYGYIEEQDGGGYRWKFGASPLVVLEQFNRIGE